MVMTNYCIFSRWVRFYTYCIRVIVFYDIHLKGRNIYYLVSTQYKRIFWRIHFYLFRQICPFMRRSLSVTFIVKVVSEKVFHLARIKVPLWHLDPISIIGIWLPKFGEWMYLTISVQTDSVNMESVVRSGQPFQAAKKMGCDTMTQRLLLVWIFRWTVFHRIP